jgi:hypothetical protein
MLPVRQVLNLVAAVQISLKRRFDLFSPQIRLPLRSFLGLTRIAEGLAFETGEFTAGREKAESPAVAHNQPGRAAAHLDDVTVGHHRTSSHVAACIRDRRVRGMTNPATEK